MRFTEFFLNLKLRAKLLLAFGSLVLLSVLIVIIFFDTLQKISVYEKASEEVDGLNIEVLEMDAAMRHFIFEGYKSDSFQLKGQSPHLRSYIAHRELVAKHLYQLSKLNIVANDLKKSNLQSILDEINIHSQKITQFFKDRGFKDYGLEGALRTAIHDVEKSSYPYDKVEMLMLRRHEKDFFLRKDLKYQKEFNDRIERFFGKIEKALVIEGKKDILNNVENYHAQFNAVVEIETQIGLKEEDGIKGDINSKLLALKKSITSLRLKIKSESSDFESRATIGLLILFICQVAVGIVLAVAYSNVITKAIKELQRAMQKLAEGYFPDALPVRSKEEIGKTKKAFNQLLERMKVATEFAKALGQGNLNAKYNSQFSQDILAQSMIQMQQQLAIVNEKQLAINWTTVGLARLNDILKNNTTDVEAMGNQILKTLVPYVNANQGILYLSHEENSNIFLQPISTYAINREKLEERIDIGQGQVGQCYVDRKPIIMTTIPKGYSKIFSGLGETAPRSLILIPLLVQDKVMGIIEMASLDLFKDHQIVFLQRISENIASMLVSRKLAAETTKMLKEAREQTQRLRTQEEAIQKNAAEMKAIQELVIREKQQELENEVASLKAKLNRQYSTA